LANIFPASLSPFDQQVEQTFFSCRFDQRSPFTSPSSPLDAKKLLPLWTIWFSPPLPRVFARARTETFSNPQGSFLPFFFFLLNKGVIPPSPPLSSPSWPFPGIQVFLPTIRSGPLRFLRDNSPLTAFPPPFLLLPGGHPTQLPASGESDST